MKIRPDLGNIILYTTDHIFTLYSLIELLKHEKKKKRKKEKEIISIPCFIDFSKAFDSVWRVGL